jgi:putative ABC transport system ATP-binding protein
MTALLDINKVHKTFQAGTVNQNHVLKDLSLRVESGDFISVIGGNGSGKSTLLNSIAGTFPIDQGNIALEGKDINHLPEEERAKDIARVFQDPLMGTAPRMTVAENLAIALKRGEKRGLGRTLNQENYEVFEDLMQRVTLNLETKLDSEVGLLSGGQRQVIALLMATIKKPKLLLLDEHVAALDPKATEQVMQITESRVQDLNITTLMITHKMQHAIAYGNRLVRMDEGRIVIEIAGEEKKNLTVSELIEQFHKKSGKEVTSDQVLLC